MSVVVVGEKNSRELLFRLLNLHDFLWGNQYNVQCALKTESEETRTSSNVFRAKKRMVVTSLVWPKRWIRAIACSSSVGFLTSVS